MHFGAFFILKYSIHEKYYSSEYKVHYVHSIVLLCGTFDLNKYQCALRPPGPGQRIHTRLPGTMIKAVAIRTPPHASLSHKGTGGHFVGPDSDMQFIDCSFFLFSLRGAVLQQRQNQTEMYKQAQTLRKIITDGHSAGWYRGS